MSLTTSAYAAQTATSALAPHSIERREPGPRDVLIDIRYCGVCHSDVHAARAEWGSAIYPMVPGHEIVGHVAAVGSEVSQFKIGDAVGVGCFVDSCRECAPCRSGDEQYCDQGMTGTYNSYERGRKQPTYGGYSNRITVDQAYVLRIPPSIALDRAAPLLCAGITTYSPLRHYGVKAGDKVAVVGLGGLGHMGVKIARAMGCDVTVLSSSPGKREDALALGAHDFASTRDADTFKQLRGRFDFILNTISAAHDYNAYLGLLKLDGTMCLVGMPDAQPVHAGALIMRRRRLAGSLIGGIAETQEMLDFCAEHNVAADIELIDIADINTAWDRMVRSDVRYRFVIDCATLNG